MYVCHGVMEFASTYMSYMFHLFQSIMYYVSIDPFIMVISPLLLHIHGYVIRIFPSSSICDEYKKIQVLMDFHAGRVLASHKPISFDRPGARARG